MGGICSEEKSTMQQPQADDNFYVELKQGGPKLMEFFDESPQIARFVNMIRRRVQSERAASINQSRRHITDEETLVCQHRRLFHKHNMTMLSIGHTCGNDGIDDLADKLRLSTERGRDGSFCFLESPSVSQAFLQFVSIHVCLIGKAQRSTGPEWVWSYFHVASYKSRIPTRGRHVQI